ncbi:ricin B lectin domain-containing protein [Dichotomocladium elegans]|nr:ricin B lectin domain-containing protein [Dichotomocladium elegans]
MADFPEGYFYIRSRMSGKVVDVDGASLKNDAKVLLWTPKHNDDRDNQLWYYQDGFLINKKSNKVLDVRGGPLHENAVIIQYDRKLVADAQNQRWGYNSRDGYIYILASPTLVLDVRGGSSEDGARLILYHRKPILSHDELHQQWDLVPAGEVRAQRELLFESDAF